MIIDVVKGDMVKHAKSEKHFDAYAHQCNCYCRMGRGIAPQLAKAFSEVRHVDNNTYNITPEEKLGTISIAETDGPIIYNAYGQLHWEKQQVVLGRNTDYGALARALVAIRRDMQSKGLRTLGVPKIGCGLAGGDWLYVRDLIDKIFDSYDIAVVVFIL